MKETGIWLIDIDGASYLIQAAEITKNEFGYGYFLTVTLLNGRRVNIGYCGLDNSGLKPVLEVVSQHVKSNSTEALDLRIYFKRGNESRTSYHGCTYARL